jgi:hypothetical protein
MKLVRESIEFQRGGNILKTAGLGQIAVIKKKLADYNINDQEIENQKESLEKLSRKWTKKGKSGSIYAGKTLSDAIDQNFSEDLYQKDDPQYPVRSPEARQFFKNLIFKTARNNYEISMVDFLEAYDEFIKKIHRDPLWFEAIISGLLYSCEMA